MASSMWIATLLIAVTSMYMCVIAETEYEQQKEQRCSCVTGPPDYLCPTASLLQVYLPHDCYCTRYYKCTDGRAIEMQCPYGTYFNTTSNTCACDFTVCYRQDPCIRFIDACRCCAELFDTTGLAPENFYVCYNDGYAVAKTCPMALDPCTNTTIQLQLVNNKCQVPPPLTTTTVVTTTTTVAP